jgi:hypothetical protein
MSKIIRKKRGLDAKPDLFDFKKFEKELNHFIYEDSITLPEWVSAELKDYKILTKKEFLQHFSDDEYNLYNYVTYKKLREVRNNLYKRISYIQEWMDKLEINLEWKRPQWTYLKPKSDERRNKVSRHFWPVYAYLWENRLPRKATIEFFKEHNNKNFQPDHKFKDKYKEYGQPLGYGEKHSINYKEEVLPAITIFDTKKVAKILGSTENNIGKIIRKWEQGPIKKIGMTKPKNEGGSTVYHVGYWTVRRRIPFFTKKNSEKFIREILFRSKD